MNTAESPPFDHAKPDVHQKCHAAETLIGESFSTNQLPNRMLTSKPTTLDIYYRLLRAALGFLSLDATASELRHSTNAFPPDAASTIKSPARVWRARVQRRAPPLQRPKWRAMFFENRFEHARASHPSAARASSPCETVRQAAVDAMAKRSDATRLDEDYDGRVTAVRSRGSRRSSRRCHRTVRRLGDVRDIDAVKPPGRIDLKHGLHDHRVLRESRHASQRPQPAAL